MKRRSPFLRVYLSCAVVCATVLSVWGIEAALRPNVGGEVPAIVRLHVVPHSDHPADQDLKLRVRDDVLDVLRRLEAPTSSDAFLNALHALKPEIEARVGQRLAAEAGEMPFRIKIGWDQFDSRELFGHTVPAGRYLALQIILGDGNGGNFWCVIFPAMCFVPDEIEHLVEPLQSGRVAFAAPVKEDDEHTDTPLEDTRITFRSVLWDRIQGGLTGSILRSLQAALLSE